MHDATNILQYSILLIYSNLEIAIDISSVKFIVNDHENFFAQIVTAIRGVRNMAVILYACPVIPV